MRYISKKVLTKTVLAAVLTASSLSPAVARIPFGAAPLTSPANYPGAPKPIYDDATPYPMNYADEAVQTLGFRGGNLSVFSTKLGDNNPYLPALKGDVGGQGAMLKLQWHPGE